MEAENSTLWLVAVIFKTIWDQVISRNSICSLPLPSSKMGYMFDLQESIKQGPLTLFWLCLFDCGRENRLLDGPWTQSIPIWSTCLGGLNNLVSPSLVREKLLYHVDKICLSWLPFVTLVLYGIFTQSELRLGEGMELTPGACSF